MGTASAAPPHQPLRLSTLTPLGQPGWGDPHDAALGVLLGAHSAFLPAHMSTASVQQELADGALHPSALRGLPVAVWATRAQLQPTSLHLGTGSREEGDGFFAAEYRERQAAAQQPVLVAGCVVEVSGKRVRAAFDFSQPPGPADAGLDSLVGSQRTSTALVRIARLPEEECEGSSSRSGRGGAEGAEPLAPPCAEACVTLDYPCSEMWRLTGAAAVLLGCGAGSSGGSGGGAVGAPAGTQGLQWEQEQQQQAAAKGQGMGGKRGLPAPQQPGLPRETALYPLHCYLSGQGWLFAPGSGAAAGSNGTLLCVRLQRLELLALAAVSGDPLLAAATLGPGDASRTAALGAGSRGAAAGQDAAAYSHLSNCWATAAGRVAAGGGSNGQLGVPLSAGTCRAVVHAMVHGWSAGRLAEGLGCPKPAATALQASFLAAFPALWEWREATVREGERRGFVATLAGRQRAFALDAKADAMVRCREGRGRGR